MSHPEGDGRGIEVSSAYRPSGFPRLLRTYQPKDIESWFLLCINFLMMGHLKSNSGQRPTSGIGSASWDFLRCVAVHINFNLSSQLFKETCISILVLAIIEFEFDIAREDLSRDTIETRDLPSQLGQTGSRNLAATLRDFSLFADRTATPQRRRSKRAIRSLQ
jgi:hypothetical protein